MTRAGRKRFLDYIDVLERVVRDAVEAAQENEGNDRPLNRMRPRTA